LLGKPPPAAAAAPAEEEESVAFREEDRVVPFPEALLAVFNTFFFRI
jgi:hypothetical protein